MELEIATSILTDYEKQQTYLNIALANALSESMDQHSKDVITRLVYGTIQYRLYLNYLLAPHLKGQRVRPLERMVLLTAMYQHEFMHTPDYAIVNNAVALVKKKRGKRSSAFVNGVLRHAFDNPRSLDDLEASEKLSVKESLPLWLIKMWQSQYGVETTQKLAHSLNEVPLKAGRVNTLHLGRDAFLEKYDHFHEGNLCEDAVIYEGGSIAATEAFKNGDVIIQDESAQMVARLLNPTPGDTVVDLCSAPGGKTTHLAALMNNEGHIDAFDVYEHKMTLIQDNCQRLGVNIVETHCGDSTDLSVFNGRTYDKVLLDGPCSGLGVLARKPEIRYHDSDIMDKIIPIQQKLLDNAYALCKNKGNIVYSTCTLNKKENEHQIAALLKRHEDLHKIKEVTIFPYQYHSDGFYMCLLEKD